MLRNPESRQRIRGVLVPRSSFTVLDVRSIDRSTFGYPSQSCPDDAIEVILPHPGNGDKAYFIL